MSSLKQPVGQKLLTNVAIVRLKKGGCRFEIACYKNKVLSWRAGVEKDIDEVLQINQVFSNVSKGVKAKPADMEKVFHTSEHNAVCKYLLDQGELQLSEKEREHNLDQLFRDVVHIIAEKCVNPQTQRPVTIGVVERMMREAHISLSMNQTAKVQALESIKVLEKKFPIQRAAMRVRITVKGRDVDEAIVRTKLQPLVFQFQPSQDPSTLIALIAPGKFRELDAVMTAELSGCNLEVLNVAVQQSGEQSLEADHESSSVIISDGTGLLGAAVGAGAGTVGGEGAGVSATDPVWSAASVVAPPAAGAAAGGAKKLGCNSCGGVTFDDVRQHREHFKTEWHRYNLKQKVAGLPSVDKGTFDELALMMESDSSDPYR